MKFQTTVRQFLKFNYRSTLILFLFGCDQQIKAFVDQASRATPSPSEQISTPLPPVVAPVAAPSNLSYTASSLKAFQLTPIASLSPTVTGVVTSYSVSPALPAGLILNPTTGVLSGTATANQAATTHTITASNATGSVNFTISISTGPTFTVNSNADGSDATTSDGICLTAVSTCTLRAAIQQSNAIAFPVQILVPNSTIFMSGTEITVTGDITIVGASPDAVILSAGGFSRIFNSTSPSFSISKMILMSGNAGSTAASEGGAIKQNATDSILTLDQVTLLNNTMASTVNGGGAVYFKGGRIVITNSTFMTNSNTTGGGSNIGAGALYIHYTTLDGSLIEKSNFVGNTTPFSGGAIFLAPWATSVTITDSSFVSNISAAMGGAIYTFGSFNTYKIIRCFFSQNKTNNWDGGAIYFSSLDTWGSFVQNSTFYNNQAPAGNGGAIFASSVFSTPPVFSNNTFEANVASQGAAVYSGGSLAIPFANTIFGSSTGSNCAGTFGPPVASRGYNLDANNSCSLNPTGDLINTNPLFANGGVPASNGGPTNTIALLPASPAKDSGSPVSCLATDQRGIARPRGARCDMGAFEY